VRLEAQAAGPAAPLEAVADDLGLDELFGEDAVAEAQGGSAAPGAAEALEQAGGGADRSRVVEDE